MLRSYSPLSASFRNAIYFSILLLPSVIALDITEFCSWDNVILNYGPFKPWPKSILNTTNGPPNSNMACWYYADCIYSIIPETSKQQKAATALVMGLVPLILKDVAWPQRRVAYIPGPEPQVWYTEILVRGLGLNPVITKDPINYGRTFGKIQSHALFFLLLLALLSMYGVLAVIEFFSKRSSLGCPVPIFIVAWFILGLAPSCIEVAASRWRTRHGRRDNQEGQYVDNREAVVMGVMAPEAIPGSTDALFVQFAWAIYYTAGTLVFNSIMLVTVLELFVWVMASCAMTAVSKMFAYKLCGYWGEGFKQ